MGYFKFVVIICLGLSPAVLTEDLPPGVKNEIQGKQASINLMKDHVLRGPAHHQAWNRLANLTDFYGPRSTGSQSLEDAIDYLKALFEAEGFDNVHTEDVTADHWERGSEYVTMLLPRRKNLAMLSLGSSVGTGPEGITADVVVVNSFDDLSTANAAGKIVVYNQPWKGYRNTVQYRSRGASEAAKYQARATLIRSMTGYSLNTPHTGQQTVTHIPPRDYDQMILLHEMSTTESRKTYSDPNNKIPTACISVEDARMMQRMQDRGQRIQVHLYINATNHPPTTTRNLVAEITGSIYPDQYVIFGGHIDSWDVGMGAMDDGGGSIISWQALSTAKQLGLRPKRTMRLVLWSAEEIGLVGAQQYYDRHQSDRDKVSLIMESDSGTFNPTGLGFTGSSQAKAIIREILSNLKDINTSSVVDGGSAPDIGVWLRAGVPGANLQNENKDYFHYHHTEADTMDLEDPDVLDRASLLWAVATFVVADLENPLPRDSVETTTTDSVSSDGHTICPSAVAIAILLLAIVSSSWFKL